MVEQSHISAWQLLLWLSLYQMKNSLLHDRQPQEYLGDIYAHHTGWADIRHLEQQLVKNLDDRASHLWLMSSSLFVSSPGFAQGAAAAPLGRVPSAPACTRCPWSPGREGSGCRWCWPLWGLAAGCHRSPGSPSLCCPHRPSQTPPVLSGGFQPGCSDRSCLSRRLRLCLAQWGEWSWAVSAAFEHLPEKWLEWVDDISFTEGGAAGPPPFFSLELQRGP